MRVILLSGGLDSAVALLSESFFEVGPGFDLALSVDYGQPHRSELEAARRLAARAGVDHEVVSVGFPVAPASGLLGGHDLTAADSVVPGRNVLFVALAAMRGATDVTLGCNADDQADYPDCRPDVLVMSAQVCGVSVSLPLVSLTKGEILERASDMGLAAGDTVSCYRGNQCGECAACRLRGDHG